MAESDDSNKHVSDGELRVRVGAVETRTNHIETQVNLIRDTMATRIDIDRISVSISNLAASQSQSQRTQWPVILSAMALTLTFLVLIGGFAYGPVRDSQNEMKATLSALNAQVIGRFQYDRDQTILHDKIKSAEDQMQYVRRKLLETPR